MNAGPQLLITSSGSPWWRQTCSRNNWVSPAESKEVTVGTALLCLDRQSTAMMTALYPLESRRSPIMSTEITCQHQSGTLLGISFPPFCIGKVFIRLHASHPAMNLVTYLDNPGHQ